MTDTQFLSTFREPPKTFGPIPFYWWTGEKLDRDRMAWQLDQLLAKGVRQTVISYPHGPDGHNEPGDPPVFSPAWWEFLRWFLEECGQRGMTTGFQDYTLVHPILKAIGHATPDMEGGQMSSVAKRCHGSERVSLRAEDGSQIVLAAAYRISDDGSAGEPIDLTDHIADGVLSWNAPAGDWLVALVFARLSPFDPLHPESGRLAIERLYAPFEKNCPDHLGRTLNLFFQDELDFGARMPFWSNQLFDTFLAHTGYDLRPWLPALWHDLGPRSAKIRLDFADAVTTRIEDCYFKPVFEWHESRGTMFGHDNCGRGRMALGRSHYGDYFRTMRWYSAPGCDDPKLGGERAFKGLKVNSSIARLYQRPRVWVEAFHSSGWGVTPSEVVAAINEDFAYGATVVNLHGLYYTTRGGWWEWAPPDFHFRQPYWQHSSALNAYFTRLCWLLTQGGHQCDVAMLYPIAALDAAPADPSASGVFAHVGNHTLAGIESPGAGPEETAFQLGKFLFDRACDFVFIDHQSLERWDTTSGLLATKNQSGCRVLILPAMAAARFDSLLKAQKFVQSGGTLIAFGCLPETSNHGGARAPQTLALLQEIFGPPSPGDTVKEDPSGGSAYFIRQGFAKVLETIGARITRDVASDAAPLQVLHRSDNTRDIYYLFNPSLSERAIPVRFRAHGQAMLLDAWTGDCQDLGWLKDTVTLTFGARCAKILVIKNSAEETLVPTAAISGAAGQTYTKATMTLEGPWEFSLAPTLDNRFGDFQLPASSGCLGPQARQFRYQEEYAESLEWQSPDFDDKTWPETTWSFGKRFEVLGPLAPDSDWNALESALLAGESPAGAVWQPYDFSLQLGIERDPFLTEWLSGPHGLKGTVPDDFLDFFSPTPGTAYYLRAIVSVPHAGEWPVIMGGRCAHQAWINGQAVIGRNSEMPPGLYAPWNIPHYECVPERQTVHLEQGENRLLIKLVQPHGQRTRAFIAFEEATPTSATPQLRWFQDPTKPRPAWPAAPTRRAVWFRFSAPPGLKSLQITARGPVDAWADGQPLCVASQEILPNGHLRIIATASDPLRQSSRIALRVAAPPAESRGGDVLPAPVEMFCEQGQIDLGDWCPFGLAHYSGIGIYEKSFFLDDQETTFPSHLDLGDLRATAEVQLNGQSAGTLVAAPWLLNIRRYLKPGKNHLAIRVANTLANHYCVGIPSPYAFPEQTPSGLFGPVRLLP